VPIRRQSSRRQRCESRGLAGYTTTPHATRCSNWWSRHEHSEFGWKIENVTAGEPEVPENLRAFNVRNGFDVASKQPHCQTTADRAGVLAGEYVSPPRNRGV
jgi:hypothetical protein